MEMALGLLGKVGLGGAASTATSAAGAAGAAAGGMGAIGSTIASILQGTASLMGVMALNKGAGIEATSFEMEARDAEAEKALENLQGIGRSAEIKRSLRQAVGEMDVAYGASGVDLTFGTPSQARTEAFREADVGLTTSANTTLSRTARLDERAANYRSRAKSVRQAARTQGRQKMLSTAADIMLRG